MTTNNETLIEISLFENGIDFILKGISELFADEIDLEIELEFEDADQINTVSPTSISPSSYKYGVLHLFSGFLLLLKERLYRHMEELIFAGKISEVKQKLQKNKIPNTVDLDEALERLEIGPRVTFSDDDVKIIRKIQDTRNKLEHYKVSINKHELWSNISSFLNIIDSFMDRHLRTNIEDHVANQHLYYKIQRIGNVSHRLEKKLQEAREREIQQKWTVFEIDRNEILKELDDVYREEQGGVDVFIQCPSCYEDTLIAWGEHRGLCSNEECREYHELSQCERCGRVTVDKGNELVFCEDCDGYIDSYIISDE